MHKQQIWNIENHKHLVVGTEFVRDIDCLAQNGIKVLKCLAALHENPKKEIPVN